MESVICQFVDPLQMRRDLLRRMNTKVISLFLVLGLFYLIHVRPFVILNLLILFITKRNLHIVKCVFLSYIVFNSSINLQHR